jgi:hypothetical protein
MFTAIAGLLARKNSSVTNLFRNGHLSASEEGEIGGPCKTISDAMGWGAGQHGGEFVEIDTNIQLGELFEIMNTNSFEPLMHNLSRLTLNGVDIDAQSFQNFVTWYADCRKASAAKKLIRSTTRIRTDKIVRASLSGAKDAKRRTTVSRKENEPFEVVTFDRAGLGQFGAGGQPPRSARHVATVSWAWGPAGSHRERLLICSWKRRGWTLWAMADDFEYGRMYAKLASATPFHGYTAKFAAERLLTAAWKDQSLGEDYFRSACVDEEGLLTKTDIENIQREVFGARE